MNLVALAAAVANVAGLVSGVGPVITNVVQLGAVLKQLGADLQAMPINTSTGKPLSIDEAQAHLAAAVATSEKQTDTIRTNALAALAENETEGKV